MGEFSDHFEQFPEDNPANWDEYGRFITPEQRAERERLRIANEKLDKALLRRNKGWARLTRPNRRPNHKPLSSSASLLATSSPPDNANSPQYHRRQHHPHPHPLSTSSGRFGSCCSVGSVSINMEKL